MYPSRRFLTFNKVLIQNKTKSIPNSFKEKITSGELQCEQHDCFVASNDYSGKEFSKE